MAKIYPKMFFGGSVVDENAASLSIASSAILYGLSVYTVLPAIKSEDNRLKAFRLYEHLKRLQDSAKIMGFNSLVERWEVSDIKASLSELIEANRIYEDVFVRATIHVDEKLAGTRSRGLSTNFSMFAYEAEAILPPSGARLKTSVWRRVNDNSIPARAKVNGAYVNSVLAKQDALDSGYDDCIFLDAHGHVCELSAANIFLVRGGKLITPSVTSDLLEGINRLTILQLAKEDGIEVEERQIDLSELYIADEVFAVGTSALLSPVLEIDARIIGEGKIGPITKRLRRLHSDVLRGKAPKHADWLTVL